MTTVEWSVDCPLCGEESSISEGVGVYQCPFCSGDFEVEAGPEDTSET